MRKSRCNLEEAMFTMFTAPTTRQPDPATALVAASTTAAVMDATHHTIDTHLLADA